MGIVSMLQRPRASAFAIYVHSHGSATRPKRRPTCSASLGEGNPPCMPLFYSDIYTYPLPANHRFPMHKYEAVRKRLQSHPLLTNSTFTASPLATRRELEAAHSRDYIDRFLHGGLSPQEERAIGLPWTLSGVRRALGSTGGTVAATLAALRTGGLAGQLAGGTHHASRDGGAGFCVFNDLAVGAHAALARGARKVLLLDLDVHQGEGSAAIFARDARVATVSFHAEGNYPFEKGDSDVDVAFGDGAGDEEYLEKVAEVVPRVLDGADVVILQMGVDGLASDRLGRLRLTRQGLSRRNMMVYREVVRRRLPAVVTMGGGYAEPIEDSIAAHCDVYTDAVRAMAEGGVQ